jgi:hypothetical protein
MPATLEEVKTQRSSIKGSITRIKTLIEEKGETLTIHDIECRLGILESYFKHLLTFKASYESLAVHALMTVLALGQKMKNCTYLLKL